MPGYVSLISVLPEYGLGITVLVGCQDECSELLSAIQEIVSVGLVQAAEDVIWQKIEKKIHRPLHGGGL